MTIPAPDFVIAGDPRCGTTALYSYLSEHDQIFLPALKEPHFFAPELGDLRQVATHHDYISLFENAAASDVTGEGSVWYLHSERAIAQLVRHRPDVRLVLMLRNPVDFLESVHQTLVLTQVQEMTDFEEAWRCSSSLPAGETQWLLDYRNLASFGAHLERLCRTIQRERVLIHTMQDLKVDPRSMYQETLNFLGVTDDGRRDFAPTNERIQFKSALVGRLLIDPPEPIRTIRKVLQRASTSETSSPLSVVARGARRIIRLNWESADESPISNELRREILNELRSDIDLAESILQRDLGSWRV